MQPKTYVSLDELYDLYIEMGDVPPEWIARMLGKPGTRKLDGDALYRAAVDAGIPSLFAVADKTEGGIKPLANGDGIYICGAQGAGKTWMACRIAKEWLAEGMGSVRFVPSVQLLAEIADTYGGRSEGEGSVMARYTKCSLLVVDDLGKEVPSTWALSKLFALFDTRYANNRPTIITTQFGTDALAKRMAQSGDVETAMAIVSRFREKYKALNLGNVDRRAASR